MTPSQIAAKYIGMKENEGNKFDDSSILGQILHKAGQKDGEAWCAYFAEAVFCEAYPERNGELRKLFSASAVKTYENFKNAAFLCNELPRANNLVVWQRYDKGVKQWTGHVGIVENVMVNGSFTSIEGNTNGAGSREGDSVQRKVRSKTKVDTGLNVLGFIQIYE